MTNPFGGISSFVRRSYGTIFRPATGWMRSIGGQVFGGSQAVTPEVLNAVTVARCIAVIADGLASCPLLVERRVGKGKWEALDPDSSEFHGIAQLLDRPNREQGGAELRTLHHGAKHAFGRSYLLLDPLAGGSGRPGTYPRELRFLPPNQIEPQYSTDPRIHAPIGYRYSAPGATPVMLAPDEVMPDRLPSYMNPLDGQSPAVSAAYFALIERVLGWYHFGYFKNGARAGLVVSTDQRMTKQQLNEQRDSWNEQHAVAQGKAFATVFLGAGMRVQEQQAGRKEGDFLDLAKVSKEQIYTAFGVPPAIAGDFSNAALANIEEQTPIFMEGTLEPRGRVTQDQYNLHIVPRFDGLGRIRFRHAWERTPAMKRRALERAKTYVTLTGVPILMPDEAREMEGLPPLPNGTGSVLYIPFSMSPAGLDPAPAPAPLPPAASDPKPEDKAAHRRKWIDDPARHEKRAQAVRRMQRFIPGAEREIDRFLRNQEARLIARVEAMDAGKAAKVTGGELFDVEFESEAMREVLVRIYARVITTRGAEAFEEVAASGSFSMDHADVVEYLRRHAYENGKLITEASAERLSELVTQSVESSETIQDLTDSIRELYNVRRDEAQRIARTEVASSYNFASNAAFAQSGVVEKTEWLSAHDDAVRDSHRAIDGEQADLGAKFSNGLAFPGDPSGDASEVINCRCTVLPVTRREPTPEDGERAYGMTPDLAALFEKSC